MRPIRLLPLALLVAGLLAIPSTAAADSCSGSLSGGFWTQITATNTSCASAKSLIRRWIRQTGFGHVDPPATARVGAYTCKIKFKSSQGESGKLTCTASRGRKVTAVGSP
jgi:hypothetical protein